MTFRCAVFSGLGLLMAAQASAYELDINAKAAYLYHPASGKVLFQQNAQQPYGPASLTKLMTVYLLFQAIENNQLTLESELPISEKAWRKGGSKMFLEVGKTVKVADLIQGIIVASGNDACIVVAEYLGGTEDGFAAMMNKAAENLGMYHTNFVNASGWPEPTQNSTAEDMVKLAAAIQQNFPQYYPYFSQQSFEYSGIRQSNRNGLLKQNVGVDGMKTGHTEESGYHLLASGKQGQQRLISIVLGAGGFAAREGENLKLLRYGFTNFDTVTLWRPNTDVLELPVWLGSFPRVTVRATQGAATFANKHSTVPEQVTVSYITPLPAPVEAGQTVGEMTVTFDGETFTSPLVVAESVAKAGFMERFMQKLFYRLGLE